MKLVDSMPYVLSPEHLNNGVAPIGPGTVLPAEAFDRYGFLIPYLKVEALVA